MKRLVSHTLSSLMLLSLAGAGGSAGTPLPDSGSPRRFSSTEAHVLTLLRTLRDPKAPGPEVVGPELHELGPAAIDQLLRTLDERRIPHPTDRAAQLQVLSEPQTDAVLGALDLFGRDVVLPHWEMYFAEDPERVPTTWSAIQSLGGFGMAVDLDRMWALALIEEQAGEGLSAAVASSLEVATASILARDPEAFGRLAASWAGLPKTWTDELVRAVGRAGDPAGNALFSDMLTTGSDQDRLVASQVTLLGPSDSERINQRLAGNLLTMLGSDSKADVQAAVLAIGTLEDFSVLPTLIALLDDERPGVAQNAHHALRVLTLKPLMANRKLWERWYKEELQWARIEKNRVLRLLSRQQQHLVIGGLREVARRRLDRHHLAERVAECLLSPRPGIRLMAAQTLHELGSRWGGQELVQCLADSDDGVREAAHAALVKITGEDLGATISDWGSMEFPGHVL